MKDNNVNDEPIFDVKLKSIFGIEPKIYVLCLTVFLVLLPVIFMFTSKLRNPGSYLIINANIPNSYVFYNDKYLGRTPVKKYILASKGVLKVKRIGYKTYEDNIEIKNSFFRSKKLNIELKLNDPDKILTLREKELSIMSQIKNFSENMRPIPVFSIINTELKEHPEFIKEFLAISTYYISSSEMFKDFMRTYKEIYSLSSNVTHKELFKSLCKELNLDENSIVWFLSNFKEEELEVLLSENWVKENLNKINKKNKIEFENKKFNYSITGFTKVNAQNIKLNTKYSINNENINIENSYGLREFLIQNNNVTKQEYQKFLNENPNWNMGNKNNLIKKELVDENYLKDFEKISQNDSVTYISYFAAKAYADWYSKKLPKELKARLPISAEFELFEKNKLVNLDNMNINEISKKVGFWNIMEDYNPKNSYLMKADIYDTKFNSLISDIKTYNYENNKTIGSFSRAFIAKYWVAPNIGFKLVIIKE